MTARIYYADLWGLREGKYQSLTEGDIALTEWDELKPGIPYYFFIPRNETDLDEYMRGWKVTDIFLVNVMGFQTHRDDFAIAFDDKVLRNRIEEFRDDSLSDGEIRDKYKLKDNQGWNVANARKDIRLDSDYQKGFTKCLYRPFDIRYCYFSNNVMDRLRPQLLKHVFEKENLCMLLPRQIATNDWRHVNSSTLIAESCVISTNTTEQNYVFPLYLYPTEGEMQFKEGRRPNLNPEFIKDFSEKLGLKFIEDGKGDLKETFGPEDIFNYAYAIFHSPTYRTRYAEFLKIDFPRLPLTSNKALFKALAEKGAELVSLHLMKSQLLNTPITSFPEKGEHTVERVSYDEKTKRVYINKTQFFEGVPPEVWNFHIGGYQVCEKWLKDRQKAHRKLSIDDIDHYQKMVVAITETIRLMAEIDALIPGWPLV